MEFIYSIEIKFIWLQKQSNFFFFFFSESENLILVSLKKKEFKSSECLDSQSQENLDLHSFLFYHFCPELLL